MSRSSLNHRTDRFCQNNASYLGLQSRVQRHSPQPPTPNPHPIQFYQMPVLSGVSLLPLVTQSNAVNRARCGSQVNKYRQIHILEKTDYLNNINSHKH